MDWKEDSTTGVEYNVSYVDKCNDAKSLFEGYCDSATDVGGYKFVNCPTGCSNGVCNPAVCGDVVCSGEETCSSCSTDCGACVVYHCGDGKDNDEDLLIDYPDDPGCTSATDPSESSDKPCKDSDGGLVPAVYGSVTYFIEQSGASYDLKTTKNDVCYTTSTLTEAVCNPSTNYAEFVSCQYGCSNGVCKPPPTAFCGNSVCDGNETCSTCSTDCGSCPLNQTVLCGNGFCDSSESYSTCPADCPKPSGSHCSDGIDNDEDGLVDYPNDPQCTSLSDPAEAQNSCTDTDDGYVTDPVKFNGYNLEAKGTVTAWLETGGVNYDVKKVHEDYCFTNLGLKEGYCDGNTLKVIDHYCTQTYPCIYGACAPQPYGACVVTSQTVGTGSINYFDPDLRTGYAKQGQPGVGTINGLRDVCTDTVFDNLFALYCTQNSYQAYWVVVTFNEDGSSYSSGSTASEIGNVKLHNCPSAPSCGDGICDPSIGEDYLSCPADCPAPTGGNNTNQTNST